MRGFLPMFHWQTCLAGLRELTTKPNPSAAGLTGLLMTIFLKLIDSGRYAHVGTPYHATFFIVAINYDFVRLLQLIFTDNEVDMELSRYLAEQPQVEKILQWFPPELVSASRLKLCSPGQILVQKNAVVEYAYAIIAGKMVVYNETPEGKFSIWLEISPPALISDLEVIAGEGRYAANVLSTTESAVLQCNVSVFSDLLHRDPEFLWKVSAMVSQRNYDISYLRGRTDFCSNLDKAALFLLHYCNLHPPTDVSDTVVKKSRATIASETIISRRTLDRCLRQLQERGCFSIVKGKIHISQEQYLKLSADWGWS